MRFVPLVRAGLLLTLLMGCLAAKPERGDGDLKDVKHVVVIMQENHSFDNHFAALAYAPGSPYIAGCLVAARKITIAWTACSACRTRMAVCDATTRTGIITARWCPRFTIRVAACLETWITRGWERTRK